jgi:hypothetical protein
MMATPLIIRVDIVEHLGRGMGLLALQVDNDNICPACGEDISLSSAEQLCVI